MPDPNSQLDPSANRPDATRPLIADRYEIVRVLGEGSSARTLLCVDRAEDRRVAIKELHFARLGDWKFLELFEREAKTLSMLDHPGIPRVYDYFQGGGDEATYYIVQEFIEGPSLQQRMDSGPMLGQQEIYDLAFGLLDVLDYLHGRAPPVIHRDIKPSNILLPPGRGPALIDFGGVNVGWQPPGLAGTTVVGTFGYMPPEQLVGQGGPTSDLYALGATLLHLVTGRAPAEFSFDAGRIEVPVDLPIEPSLGRLIEALLRPAPRDRPRTARDARLVMTAPPRTVLKGAESTALARARIIAPVPAPDTPRFAMMGTHGEPRLVNMGEPPRDPEGEFRDVYRNLVHPLFPARRAWGDGEHVLWLGFAGATAVATLGAAALLYRQSVSKRRIRYDALFRLGLFTPGTIRSVTGMGSTFATVKYEFEAGGGSHVGYMEYPREIGLYWSTGDVVSVLYDPENPGRSCVVYR